MDRKKIAWDRTKACKIKSNKKNVTKTNVSKVYKYDQYINMDIPVQLWTIHMTLL